MIFYSWNVNGIRAAFKKNYWEWFRTCGGDVICLQETKAHPDQLAEEDKNPQGYQSTFNPSKGKKGYSGVACYYGKAPLTVTHGLSSTAYQGEGRTILLEYPDYYFYNIYFPNGQKDEERLAYKMGFYDAFLEEAEERRREKPIIVCGDFNTAHKEIDLARPKQNQKTSGFLPMERAWIDKFIANGYVDTFRMFDEGPDNYTWWSFRANARAKNVGWRIDYFFVSEELEDRVKRAWIEPEVMGSDHCPLGLEIEE